MTTLDLSFTPHDIHVDPQPGTNAGPQVDVIYGADLG